MKYIKLLFSKKNIARIVLLLLFPLSLIMAELAKKNPWLVEKYYSTLFYPIIAKSLSFITSIFGFSAAEAVIVLFPFFLDYIFNKENNLFY